MRVASAAGVVDGSESASATGGSRHGAGRPVGDVSDLSCCRATVSAVGLRNGGFGCSHGGVGLVLVGRARSPPSARAPRRPRGGERCRVGRAIISSTGPLPGSTRLRGRWPPRAAARPWCGGSGRRPRHRPVPGCGRRSPGSHSGMATPTSYSRVPRLRFRRSVLVDSSIADRFGRPDRAACVERVPRRVVLPAPGLPAAAQAASKGSLRRVGRSVSGPAQLRVRLDQDRRCRVRSQCQGQVARAACCHRPAARNLRVSVHPMLQC